MSEVTGYEWLIEVFLLHRRTKIQPFLPPPLPRNIVNSTVSSRTDFLFLI